MEPAPLPTSPRSPLAGRWRLAAAVAACLVLAVLLRPFPSYFKFRHGGDCVRYLTWSRVVQQQGLAAFPALVAEYRTRWIGFPPPTRWLWLGAIAVTASAWRHPPDEYHPLVALAWVSGVLMSLATALWLRRRAPPEVVVATLVLVATAPVMRAFAHFPVPDTVQAVLCLALFAAVVAWLDRPRRWMLVVIAVVTLAVLATRETGLINLVAALALVVLDGRREGRVRWAPVWAMAAGGLVTLAITAALAGGPKQLALMTRDYLGGALFNSGAMIYTSGPWYRYWVDYMIVSPYALVTAIASVATLRRRDDLRALVDHLLVATLVVLLAFSAFSKTLRYVMVVDVGMRALAATALYAMWTARRRVLGRVAAVALFAAMVGNDLWIYHRLWGEDQIYDSVTWGFVKYLHMIP